MEIQEIKENIEKERNLSEVIPLVLRKLEQGQLRVMTPEGQSADCGTMPMTGDLRTWIVQEWVKKAILLNLKLRKTQFVRLSSGDKKIGENSERPHLGVFSYNDKLDPRADLEELQVRVVPPGVIRESAYVEKNVIVMPSFINMGAYVGEGTLVDTWATVGSCAQVGKRVHIAGGVGIGGVLEPMNARPVMIGDDAFLGSRVIVVEGAIVSSRAILGAGVCITSSTPILDVTVENPQEFRGFVPEGAIVVSGTRMKQFPGGTVPLQCAYIIGYRNDRHNEKLSLNEILRNYDGLSS